MHASMHVMDSLLFDVILGCQFLKQNNVSICLNPSDPNVIFGPSSSDLKLIATSDVSIPPLSQTLIVVNGSDQLMFLSNNQLFVEQGVIWYCVII
jgi:hypothetical protein